MFNLFKKKKEEKKWTEWSIEDVIENPMGYTYSMPMNIRMLHLTGKFGFAAWRNHKEDPSILNVVMFRDELEEFGMEAIGKALTQHTIMMKERLLKNGIELSIKMHEELETRAYLIFEK